MKQPLTRLHLMDLLDARIPPPPGRLLKILRSSQSEKIDATLVATQEIRDIYQSRLRRMNTESVLREDTRRLVSALNKYNEQSVLLVVIEQGDFNAAIWLPTDAAYIFAIIIKESNGEYNRAAPGPVG